MSTSRSGKEQGNYWIGWLQLRERVKKNPQFGEGLGHRSRASLVPLAVDWTDTLPLSAITHTASHAGVTPALPLLCARESGDY